MEALGVSVQPQSTWLELRNLDAEARKPSQYGAGDELQRLDVPQFLRYKLLQATVLVFQILHPQGGAQVLSLG